MGMNAEQPMNGVGRDPTQIDLLLDHVDVQLWILLDDHTFGAVNRACAAFHGYTVEELVNKDMYDVFPEPIVDVCRDANSQVFATGKTVQSEEWVADASGQRRLIATTKSARLGDDGKVNFVVCSGQDITDRHNVEQDRYKIEQRLHAVFDAADSVPVQGYDEERRVVFWNKASEKLYGYSKEEALGQRLEGLIIPTAMREQVIEGHERWVTANQPIPNCELTLVNKNGDDVCVYSSHIMIANSTGALEMFCVDIDLTELKRIEKDVQLMHQLESLGTVAAGIAHDFNNLLSIIFGNLDLLRLDLPTDSVSIRHLNTALNAMQTARTLTGRLLTFAKGDAIVVKTLETRELVQDIVQFNLHGSSTVATFDIAQNLWPIRADKSQIDQVIANLSVNAAQAMPDGGTLHVEAMNLSESDAGVDHPCVKIAFRDEGVGMPPEKLDRIFDLYFTTKETGSGLGLAIVHSIVTRHHGRIDVESTPGVGSKFTITLPAVPEGTADKVRAVPDQPAELDAASLHILLMDDEDVVRELGVTMLDMLGHSVVETANGDEAVEIYKKGQANGVPFDLVITDLTVRGGKGGKEVIRALLDFDPEARVMVASGYSTDLISAGSDEYDFAGKLAKPFTIAELEREISRVVTIK